MDENVASAARVKTILDADTPLPVYNEQHIDPFTSFSGTQNTQQQLSTIQTFDLRRSAFSDGDPGMKA